MVLAWGWGDWGSGCRFHGLGCRIQGLGFRVQGLGFRVYVNLREASDRCHRALGFCPPYTRAPLRLKDSFEMIFVSTSKAQ